MAPDWRPDGWLADMDAMTTQQAEEAVTAAREALAALHQVQAVTEAEAQTAAEAKAAIPGLQAALKVFSDKALAILADLEGLPLDAASRAVKQSELELANWRKLSKCFLDTMTCPHCNYAVVFEDGGLAAWDEESEREGREQATAKALEVEGVLAKRIKEHDALQESAQVYQWQLREADSDLGEAKTALAVAEKLALNADAEVDTADRRADLMQAEQSVDDAKRVSTMVSAEARAAELAETIARYAEIVRAIGPQGVRSQMMEAGLSRLNAGLTGDLKGSWLACNRR